MSRILFLSSILLSLGACHGGGNWDASNPAWGQMTQMGAQMMQGPPRPQTTTATCTGYGNTATCTSVRQ